MISKFLRLLGLRGSARTEGSPPAALNYDRWIHLDAEELAETGILEAYERLLPELTKYVSHPASVEEVIDSDLPLYSIKFQGEEYGVYGPDLDEEADSSWGRATFVFFKIINDQLGDSEWRLFAINGGNDLGGMFLTAAEARAAQASLPNRRDWPYLPAAEPPWYGQHH